MDARRRGLGVLQALLALLACQVASLWEPSHTQAQARFGDSTWVAPDASFDADGAELTAEGPRVAPRDHERRWETALRTPFRVFFLPLRIVGRGVEAGVGRFGPRFLDPKAEHAPVQGPRLGVSLAVGSGTDPGVGPSITWFGFPAADSKLRVTSSYSRSDRRRLRLTQSIGSTRPVSFRLRADYDRKPNRHFYGIGNTTLESDLSYFQLENTNAEAALLFGAFSLRQLRIVGGYSSMSPRSAYNGTPRLEDVFPSSGVPYEHQTTKELLYGVTADFAAIDEGRDPSRGVHGRGELQRATGIRSGDPDYTQWWAEGRAYLPVFAKRRVLALRGVYTGVEPSGGEASTLPFYRLVRSEGASRFAGFTPERFRDRRLMLARVEYRWEIIHRVSALALYEIGEVAPRADAFRLRDAHKSYGGGLRLGWNHEIAQRLEVAKSVEGLHVALSLGSTF